MKTGKLFRSTMVVLLTCLLAVQGALTYFMLRKDKGELSEKEPPVLAANTPQVDENVEYLNDVGKDFSFDIESDSKMDGKNLSKFVSVVDYNNNVMDIGVKSNRGYYTITAPKEQYAEGKSYKIELFNAQFKDEKLKGNKSLTFSIEKPESEKLEYSPKTKNVPKESVSEFNPQNNTMRLLGESYRSNDILLIQTFNVDIGRDLEVAYKIVDCQTDNNGTSLITYTTPTLQEVYQTVDISKKYEAEEENITFENEEYIVQQLMENPEIDVLGRALYDMSDKSSIQQSSVMVANAPVGPVLEVSMPKTGLGIVANAPPSFMDGGDSVGSSINLKNPKKIIPKKIDLKFKSFSPIDVEVSIAWEIVSGELGKIMVVLSFSHKSTIENYFHSNDKETRQSTIQTAKTTISLEVITESDLIENKLKKASEAGVIRNNHAKRLEIQKRIDKLQKELNQYVREKGEAAFYDEKYRKIGEENDRLLNQLSEIDKDSVSSLQIKALKKSADALQKGKSAKKELDKIYYEIHKIQYKEYQTTKDKVIQRLNEQAKQYKRNPSFSNSVLKIVNLYFPIYAGIAITVDIGIVIDFELQVILKGSLVIKSTEEVGTISTEHKQQEFRNNKTEVMVGFSISGSVTFKFGPQLGIGVTWAGIFNAKITAEAGVYVRLSGMGAIFRGDENELGLTSEEKSLFYDEGMIGNEWKGFGSINVDAGLYFKLGVKLSINLWIFEISYTRDLFGKEDSFFKHEDNGADLYEDLVFEDEYGLDFDQVVKKAENNLVKGALSTTKGSDGKITSALAENDVTTTFTINNDTGTVVLPNVYRRIIDAKNQKVDYEKIPTYSIYAANESEVYLSGLMAIANNFFAKEIDEYITLRIESLGESYELLFLPVRIKKDPIPVTSVDLQLADGTVEIEVGQTKELMRDVNPINASYKETEYRIKKVVLANGSELEEGFEKYVNIVNGRVSTTTAIPIGSKIYVSAVAIKDNVESNILCLDVVRTPVADFVLHKLNYGTAVSLGESEKLKLDIYPQNATVNILNDEPITVEFSNSKFAVLIKNDDRTYTLTATNDSNYLREEINILVSVGGLEQVFTFRIGDIAIKSVGIYLDEGGMEPLSQDIGLMPGESLKIYSATDPISAKGIYDVVYNTFAPTVGSSGYFSISEDGEIKISENAPVGMEIDITATINHINSTRHRITVQKIPVQRVELRLSGGFDSIALNQNLLVIADIYPLKASIKQVEFKLLNELNGVSISQSGVLSVSADAAAGENIFITAIADGIESTVLTVPIITEYADRVPVTSLATNMNEYEALYIGGTYEIWGEVNEDATNNGISFIADYKPWFKISYSAEGNRYYAKITITEEAIANDWLMLTVYSLGNTNIFERKTFAIKPVYAYSIEQAELSTYEARPGEEITTEITGYGIDKSIYGKIKNPTYTNYLIEVLSGGEYVAIDNNTIRINNAINANNPTVVIEFVLDQGYGEFLRYRTEFTIYVPVESISIEDNPVNKQLEVDRDRTYNFSIVFNNGFATNKNYDYYVEGNIDSKEKIKVNQVGNVIEVKVLRNATRGMSVVINVFYESDKTITDAITIVVKALNEEYDVSYLYNHLGLNNKIITSDIPQLQMGYSTNIILMGNRNGTSLDDLRSYGLSIEFINIDSYLEIISATGKITMKNGADPLTTYGYTIKIIDGEIANANEIDKKIGAYQPIRSDAIPKFYLGNMLVEVGTNSAFFTETSNRIRMDFGTDKYSQIPNLSVSSGYELNEGIFKAAYNGNAPRILTVTAKAELDYNGNTSIWSKSIELRRGFIANGNQLDEIRYNTKTGPYPNYATQVYGNYKLIANVYSASWTPINEFAGILDGNSNTFELFISTVDETQNIGFVRTLASGGEILNLKIKGSIAVYSFNDNWQHIGAFAGDNFGRIANCSAVGMDMYISKSRSETGAIVGHNQGYIDNCYSDLSTITSHGDTGGIAGKNHLEPGKKGGEIKDCIYHGTINYNYKAENRSIGGIVGIQTGNATIISCANYGTVKYASAENDSLDIQPCMGHIIGYRQGGTYSDCRYSTHYRSGTVDKGSLKLAIEKLDYWQILIGIKPKMRDQAAYVRDDFVGRG